MDTKRTQTHTYIDKYIYIVMDTFYGNFRCGYAFVMDPDENRMLAESVMNLIVRLVDVYVKKQDEAPAQVSTNSVEQSVG